MRNYYRTLVVIILLGIVLTLGCLKMPFSRSAKSKRHSNNPPNIEQTHSTIERIKHYRKIIQTALPFKDVIWETRTSNEKIKNITLLANFLYVETTGLKLRAYTTDTGHPEWVLTIQNPLDFPPCAVKGLPQKAIALRKRMKYLRKQIDDAEKDKGRDDRKIKTLRERLYSTTELLKGLLQNDVMYYLSKGTLHCIDRWWGSELWYKRLNFVPRGRPTASFTTVYISALDFDRLYLFDIAKRYGRNWFNLNSPVTSRPIYESPAIYFACADGKVYAFNTETGKKIWEYPTERDIKSDLLLEGDIIYVGSTDFAMYAINRHLGTLKWKYETSMPITSPAAIGLRRLTKGTEVVIERTLFFKTDIKVELYAILLDPPATAARYKLRWKFADGKKFLLYGLASAYVLGQDNQTLYSLDIETGAVLDKYSLRDFPFRVVDPNEPILYLGTADGYIFAVREPPPQW